MSCRLYSGPWFATSPKHRPTATMDLKLKFVSAILYSKKFNHYYEINLLRKQN